MFGGHDAFHDATRNALTLFFCRSLFTPSFRLCRRKTPFRTCRRIRLSHTNTFLVSDRWLWLFFRRPRPSSIPEPPCSSSVSRTDDPRGSCWCCISLERRYVYPRSSPRFGSRKLRSRCRCNTNLCYFRTVVSSLPNASRTLTLLHHGLTDKDWFVQIYRRLTHSYRHQRLFQSHFRVAS